MTVPLKLPKEHKDRIVDRVQSYFETERSEEFGRLAAEQLLDFMIGELAAPIYNQAIGDARQSLLLKMSELEDELYAVERPISVDRK
ncbi:DUF2164 domain-containing protein [Cohnella nanjingensis]|uniref:DUF2164 domain-containing protein n=1 Tax=Cohnella nanjingensis TaxID=1387779 RepID=A0A7X0RW93_9BACL|nr:DUF2164 domain-containing protein [Cohnella nanjingensis]MBB6673279.1 DUF2164 domain-containing protein [Cohnella nanjingensis]